MKLLRPCVAEFIGTFALIFVGIGAIYNANTLPPGNGGLLMVALAHGLTIAVMVSALMHISGGQLNPAVTFGLLIARRITPVEAGAFMVSQCLGGVVAALIQRGILGPDVVIAGTPQLGAGITIGQGIVIEAILTFFLVFVVFGTGVDERGRKIGGLAIGLTVALDICVGGPLTGAAMNPARTFGPALAANFWKDHYVYWVGPLLGAALAALVYHRLFLEKVEATQTRAVER